MGSRDGSRSGAQTKDRREITGAAVAVAALAIVLLGASLKIWKPNNPWFSPSPLARGRVDAAVNWWGILGPDSRDPPGQIHSITRAMVAVLPAAVVVLAALIPLILRRCRPWFGPMVAAAATMWLVQIIGWAFIWGDSVDTLVPGIGIVLMVVGLLVCIVASVVDGQAEIGWPAPHDR